MIQSELIIYITTLGLCMNDMSFLQPETELGISDSSKPQTRNHLFFGVVIRSLVRVNFKEIKKEKRILNVEKNTFITLITFAVNTLLV